MATSIIGVRSNVNNDSCMGNSIHLDGPGIVGGQNDYFTDRNQSSLYLHTNKNTKGG